MIKKAYTKKKIKIYSLGDVGELNYPYKVINPSTLSIKEIASNTSIISDKIKKSKKPLFIIGESALRGKAGEYIFETLKNFLSENNFLRKDWNALNVLNQHAASVGALDLDFHSIDEKKNFLFFDKIEKNDFKFLYLLGADNIDFDKKDKFIVYQGSHGDKGAEIADIILPGAAYTEKNGLFINLEGRLQNSYKATYPPGEAKEDWIIFNEIIKIMKTPIKYPSIEHLKDSINKSLQQKTKHNYIEKKIVDFVDDKITLTPIDYYYTNAVARSSKTMSECRQIKKKSFSEEVKKVS